MAARATSPIFFLFVVELSQARGRGFALALFEERNAEAGSAAATRRRLLQHLAEAAFGLRPPRERESRRSLRFKAIVRRLKGEDSIHVIANPFGLSCGVGHIGEEPQRLAHRERQGSSLLVPPNRSEHVDRSRQ